VKEPIRFNGTLVDYAMIGIHTAIALHIGNYTLNGTTEENGSYTFVFQEPLAFGVYPAFVSFTPQTVYEPCRSRFLNISIDTPTTLLVSLSQITVPLGESFFVKGQLYNTITHVPLPQKTVDVFLNKKQVGSGATNQTGWYMIRVSTVDLHEGMYEIYATYHSDEAQWRNTTSQEIVLTIGPGSFYFLPFLFIALILSIAGGIFLARKKLLALRKKQLVPSFIVPSILTPMRSRLLSELDHLDEKEFIIETTGKKSDTFREAIVSCYHALIIQLTNAGVVFPVSSTHLDIQQTMITQGFSKKSTEIISSLFEQAMYSSYPLGKKEVILFDTNLQSLIKKIGGMP
jgi:hypothetical protein